MGDMSEGGKKVSVNVGSGGAAWGGFWIGLSLLMIASCSPEGKPSLKTAAVDYLVSRTPAADLSSTNPVSNAEESK